MVAAGMAAVTVLKAVKAMVQVLGTVSPWLSEVEAEHDRVLQRPHFPTHVSSWQESSIVALCL